MTLARRFVAQVLGGDDASDLTDGQWAELCRTAENSNSDQLAVAQVVLKAYALRNSGNPFGASIRGPEHSRRPPNVGRFGRSRRIPYHHPSRHLVRQLIRSVFLLSSPIRMDQDHLSFDFQPVPQPDDVETRDRTARR